MKPEMAELELLKMAQNGDYEAFASLSEPYRQSACEFISKLTGEDYAEDIFMTAMLNAWKSIKSFSGKSSYRTWLFSIARYAALDHLRKVKARGEISADDQESGAPISGIADERTPAPSNKMEDDERHEMVRRALQGLSEAHRSVVLLYYYEDFKYNEIAEILGISIGTVMSRLHHAKANLVKTLGKHREDLI